MKKFLLMMVAFLVIGAAWAQTSFSSANNGKTIYYKTISATAVEVVNNNGAEGTYSGTIHIPPIVQHNGVSYAVTRIASKAFYGNNGSELLYVYIPSTVTYIGDEAFGDVRWSSVIGTSQSTITSLAKTGAAIGSYVFYETRGTIGRNGRLDVLNTPVGATNYGPWLTTWGLFNAGGFHTHNTNLVTYTVTLDLAGGTTNMPTTFNVCNGYHVSVNNLPIPTRDGFDFVNWTVGTTANVFSSKSDWSASVTLTANWTAETYTISYKEVDDSEAYPTGTYSSESAFPIALPTVEKLGYNGEWYDNVALTGTPVTQITAGTTGALTFYVKWNPIPYTIDYIVNDGEPLTQGIFTIETPTSVLPTTTREGYQFGGWYETNECAAETTTCTAIAERTQGTARSLTLYARWIRNTYSIAFNANSGTGNMETINNVRYSESVTLPNIGFEKQGYTFNSWNTSPDGTGDMYLNGSSVSNLTAENNGVATLYAMWQAGSCALQFNLNGGSSSVTDLCVQPIHNQAIGSNFPTIVPPANSAFMGWYIDGIEVNETTIWNYDEAKIAYAHYFTAIEYKADCPGATIGAGEGQIRVTATIGAEVTVNGEPATLLENATGIYSYTFSNIPAGEYAATITGRDNVVFTTENVTVHSFELKPLVTAPTNLTVQANEEVFFIAEGNGTAPITWKWNVSIDGNNVSPKMSIYNATFEADATVTAEGTYTPESGVPCASTLSVDVLVDACLDQTTVTDVENNQYEIFGFSNNCWTRENLRSTKYADNVAVPFAELYSNPEVANVPEMNGRLYNWSSAARIDAASPLLQGRVQGVCPTGWRLPVQEDYAAISANYTSEDLRGEGWIHGDGTGMNGFNALGAGKYDAGLNRYDKFASYTAYWTSTVVEGNNAICAALDYTCPHLQLQKEFINNNTGLSVRCVLVVQPEIYIYEATTAVLNGVFARGDFAISGIEYSTDGGATWTYQEVVFDPASDNIFFNIALGVTTGTAVQYRPVVKMGADIRYTGDTKSTTIL